MKINRYILSLILILSSLISARGQQAYDPYQGYDEFAYMDMDFEQNLLQPQVPTEARNWIKNYISRQAKELASKNYKVELTREGEVIIVTLQSDDLFNPNDTLLRSTAPALIRPLLKLTSDPDMYKMVYAVHTDNTGSPGYNKSLAHKRNTSIYDWIIDEVEPEQIIIPFEPADTRPLKPNNSRSNRAQNRRLEIYFIPGPKLINSALKN